jgi:transcription elongation factor GreA
MTVAGAEKLRQELTELKNTVRPRIIQAIAEARSHGDLKENAEYHAAREQQSFVEGRIADVEYKLSHAQVIDVTTLPTSTKVVFGATVCLLDEDNGSEARYQIVGQDEAEIKEGRISVTSPIARAIIGKEEGDSVDVQTPSGIKTYEIVEVAYI